MPIECSQITQSINYLVNAFDNCHKINPNDLQMVVELIAAIYNCSEQGTQYDTLVQDLYQPIANEEVIYPIDTYHSISVMILEGNITQIINGTTVTYPTGTVLNYEVTTLNQTPFIFIVNAGASVVVETLIETV